LGQDEKWCRTVDGILADFDKKSFRNLRCAKRGAWKMKQGKSAGKYPLVYNRRKSRTCGKTGVNCE